MLGKYQLRHAAGMYWLLDMEQKGPEYKKAVCMNESGAYFWKLIEEGKTKEQISEHLISEYGLDKAEAEQDVKEFFDNLQKQGIEI